MSKIVDLFPTPIYVDNQFLAEKDCENILDCLDMVFSGHGALNGDAYSSFNVDNDAISEIQKCSVITNLRQKLLDATQTYAEQYGILEPLHITNSWINIQNKGSTLNVHSHPYSVVSAALYLKADNESSPIEFYNPNPFATQQQVVSNTNYVSKKHMVEPIGTGMLVLFPSWMEHGSSLINSQNDRVVLSFNTSY